MSIGWEGDLTFKLKLEKANDFHQQKKKLNEELLFFTLC